jgi:uncharacterized protein (DUF2147 family)
METRDKIALLIAVYCACASIFAQGVTGRWMTIDDRNGKTKAIINIYKEDGRLYGEVKEILEKGKENALCTACDGSRKNQPVLGMRIIDGLTQTRDNHWEGNKYSLFDPEQGRYFRSKIWLDPDDPDKLKVRGYLFLLFRTQTWKRVNKPM